MFLRFFKSNQPLLIILFPFIVFGLWAKSIFGNFDYSTQENSVLIQLIYSMFGHNTIVISSVSALLVFAMSYFLVKLNESYILTDKSSFLPAFFYIVIVSSVRFVQTQSHVIYATIFLFFAFIQVFGAYKKDEALSKLFNASLLISIGSFFYIKLLFFFPVLLIGVIITRAVNWREWAGMLIGLMVPFILYFSILFIFDNLDEVLKSFKNDLFYAHTHVVLKLHDIIFLGLLSSLSVFSIFSVFSDYNIKKIGTRKFLSTLFFLILGVMIIYAIFKSNALELIYFIAIPLSIFLTDYFSNGRRTWIKEVFFSLLIGIIVYSQIVG